MTDMIRTFIAVEIPEKIRNEIDCQLKIFAQQDFSVKWVSQDNLHITMLFLGDVSLDFVESTKHKLELVAQKHNPFNLSLKSIDAFPSSKQPRIIWIGVDTGSDQLVTLQSDIENTLIQIGFKPEVRKFHPHLTIGRVKFRFTNPKVFETAYQSETFSVNSIVLFKSTLLPSGPVYEKLGEYKLT